LFGSIIKDIFKTTTGRSKVKKISQLTTLAKPKTGGRVVRFSMVFSCFLKAKPTTTTPIYIFGLQPLRVARNH